MTLMSRLGAEPDYERRDLSNAPFSFNNLPSRSRLNRDLSVHTHQPPMNQVRCQSPDLLSPRDRRPSAAKEAPLYLQAMAAQYLGHTYSGPYAVEPISEPPQHVYANGVEASASQLSQFDNLTSGREFQAVEAYNSGNQSRTMNHGSIDNSQPSGQNESRQSEGSSPGTLLESRTLQSVSWDWYGAHNATASNTVPTGIAAANGRAISDEEFMSFAPTDLIGLSYLAAHAPEAAEWSTETSDEVGDDNCWAPYTLASAHARD
ncbi:hypothetical protein PWT90_04916 [Aphanocladium album]|nr:hypothetical protein PWT90_04916 [Aphanocladium album]